MYALINDLEHKAEGNTPLKFVKHMRNLTIYLKYIANIVNNYNTRWLHSSKT